MVLYYVDKQKNELDDGSEAMEGWKWMVAGNHQSPLYRTENDAKWALAKQVWDIVSPLRLFAEKMRKKERE